MLARVLLALSLAQVVLLYVPLPTWPMWLARFAAIEGCLLASVLGILAAVLGGGQPLVQGLATMSALAAMAPALLILPTFRAENQSFSMMDWLTGGSTADVVVDRDIELSTGLKADVYRASGPGPHPFILVVHGGSWRSGDKGDAERESRAFAAAGFTVIDVAYRLAPEFPFPAGIEDVKCMLGRARERSAELGIDPARAALLGRSAGAEIALVAAYTLGGPPPGDPAGSPALPGSCGTASGASGGAPVQAVISLYGPTDLAWAYDNPFVPDVVQGTSALEAYLGGPPAQSPENYRLATPMTWVDRDVPPTLLLHGTAERCVRMSNAEKLHTALLARGRVAKLVLVPFAEHGFDIRPGGFGSQLSRGVILDFLRAQL